MPISYPFDPNGTRPGNKILNENITLPVAAFRNFHFIVPAFAPFHKAGVVVRLFPSGTVLTEGVDYWFTHKFTAATRSIGRPVYGSISFLNKNLAGTVSIDYQTIGGDWVQSSAKIIEMLSNTANNPRTTTWDQVADVPYAFPPTNHNWDLEDLKGMDDVVESLDSIRDAIIQSRADAWNAHINIVTGNPHHVNKNDVGLGLVSNFPPATQSQALDASNNTTYMTPLRSRQLFQSLVDQINSGNTGGGGSGSGDVLGPLGSVIGSIATFDGTTGKVIADLQQVVVDVTSTYQRTSVGKQKSNLTSLLSVVDAATATTRRGSFRVQPGTLSADRTYDLPNKTGVVTLDVDVDVLPGNFRYRTPGASGRGLPDGELGVSTAATANTVALRNSTGGLVVAPAAATGEAVTLGQAASLYLPIAGHGLVPYSKVVQTMPATPANDSLISTAGLSTLLQAYIKREEVGEAGPGSGDVVGPSASISGSIPTFSGLTGKVITDTQRLRFDLTGSYQRFSVGKANANLQTIISLVDGSTSNSYRSNFRVSPDTLSADRFYELPDKAGTMTLNVDVDLAPGTVPFRSATATGRGYRDTDLAVSGAATNGSLVVRSSTGTIVISNAAANNEAVTLGQANALYVPIQGNGFFLANNNVASLPATPNNTTTLSTAGLVNLLTNYATQADLENAGGSGDAVSLDIAVIAEANLPFQLVANTVTVIDALVNDGTMSFPANPSDKDQFAVCVKSITLGKTLTLSIGSAPVYGNAGNTYAIKRPYTYIIFQYAETISNWVAVNRGNYVPDSYPNNFAPGVYRGQVSLAGGTLPVGTNYNVGDFVDISTGATVAGVRYPTGSLLLRGSTGWIPFGATDTTDLESTLDTLIAGFNALTAALQ